MNQANAPTSLEDLLSLQAAQIRALTEATARQAEALSQFAIARATPMEVGPPSPTIDELWEAFRKVMASRLRSFRDDEGRARHVLAYFGKMRASELTLLSVDAYRDLRRGQLTLMRGTPTTPATRNREVMLLRRILNFAVERGLIAKNAIAGAEDEPEDNVREVVLGEPAIAKILEHADDTLAAFVLLKYDSGMRFNEVRTVRWAQLTPEDGGVEIFRKVTKTRKSRHAELSTRAWEACRRLPELCPFVFANPDSLQPWGQRWIHTLWDRALTASGVVAADGTRPWLHDLRRSYITLSRRRGIDEETIRKRTGHLTDAAFRRYNIVGVEDLQRAREINERHRRWEDLKRSVTEGERLPPKRNE